MASDFQLQHKQNVTCLSSLLPSDWDARAEEKLHQSEALYVTAVSTVSEPHNNEFCYPL